MRIDLPPWLVADAMAGLAWVALGIGAARLVHESSGSWSAALVQLAAALLAALTTRVARHRRMRAVVLQGDGTVRAVREAGREVPCGVAHRVVGRSVHVTGARSPHGRIPAVWLTAFDVGPHAVRRLAAGLRAAGSRRA